MGILLRMYRIATETPEHMDLVVEFYPDVRNGSAGLPKPFDTTPLRAPRIRGEHAAK